MVKIKEFYKSLFIQIAMSTDEEQIRYCEIKLVSSILSVMFAFAAFYSLFAGISWKVETSKILIFATAAMLFSLAMLLISRLKCRLIYKDMIFIIVIISSSYVTLYCYYRQLNLLYWTMMIIIAIFDSLKISKFLIMLQLLNFINIYFLIHHYMGNVVIKIDFTYECTFVVLYLLIIFSVYVVAQLNHYIAREKNYNYKKLIIRERVLNEQNQRMMVINQELDYLVHKDTLTGLMNRKGLIEELEQTIKADKKEPFAVVFIDLDNFKQVNDMMGHAEGDKVLVYVADHLKKEVHKSDLIGRLGGDEFALIIRQYTSINNLSEYINRICSKINYYFKLKEMSAVVTASFGVAIWPEDGRTAGDLLNAADTAMYAAKDHGKYNVQFYDKEM